MSTSTEIVERIAAGRTDLVVPLLDCDDWQDALVAGRVSVWQWLVYYDDVTALRLLESRGADLSALDLDDALGNAAFFGHWRSCEWLLDHGADPNFALPDTGERPLHNALCKAKRPKFLYVIRLLLERGAAVNVATMPGQESGGFMRDARTRGETPLHRAAAFADPPIIELLLAHGADKTARDAHGDSPLSWASWHLRPGVVLDMLCFGEHRVGDFTREHITADHGAGWGDGMDIKLLGNPRS